MIPKHHVEEAKRLQRSIEFKTERIHKLKRLSKLSKNQDLISEYDSIAGNAEKAIFLILESKELLDPQREQVLLRSNARARLMAKGLKDSLCNSELQIQLLNESIAEDNRKLKSFGKEVERKIGGVV